MKIKQAIIVEGKTDTQKLKKIFGNDLDTIETNGLSIDNNTLRLIADVNAARGVIVFTDPDGPGIKIRDKINSYLDFKCFNAFINKKSIKNSKKIGIAEANDADIIKALENLTTFDEAHGTSISWCEYVDNDIYIKKNRNKIAEHFNWPENINSKKLFKWLNFANLSLKDVKVLLEEGE